MSQDAEHPEIPPQAAQSEVYVGEPTTDPVAQTSTGYENHPGDEDDVREHHDEPATTAPAAPTVSLGTILLSAALALLCGAAGAWGYHTYLAPSRDEDQVAQAQVETAAEKVPSVDQDSVVASRIDRLSERVDQLQNRVEASPKPEPQPDLDPLKSQVAKISELSSQFEELSDKVDSLPSTVNRQGEQIVALQNQLTKLRNQIAGTDETAPAEDTGGSVAVAEEPATATDVETGSIGDLVDQVQRREAAKPVPETTDATLEKGARLFREGDYKQAREVFERLMDTQPTDPRVWYYAALANGFATNNWRGETERLVKLGVEHEKQSDISHQTINETFDYLPPNGGKNWLEAYRKQVRE